MSKIVSRLFFAATLLTSIIFASSLPKAEAADCSQSAMDSKVQSWMGALTASGNAKDGGFYRHYKDNASIYCHPSTGAVEIHGLIRQKYSQMNWEWSLLGYPMTDELTTPDGKGRFNHFQGGSIYWHPSTGAYEVHGLIKEQWAAFGWEKSYLGYPVSDELDDHNVSGGKYSNFQGGVICWEPKDGIKLVKGGKGPDSCKPQSTQMSADLEPVKPKVEKETSGSEKPQIKPQSPNTATNVKESEKNYPGSDASLKSQINDLKSENEKLRKEISKLKAENEKLRKESGTMKKETPKSSQDKGPSATAPNMEKKSESPSSTSKFTPSAGTIDDKYADLESELDSLKTDVTNLFQLVDAEVNDRKQADSKILPSLIVYSTFKQQNVTCDKGDAGLGGGFGHVLHPEYLSSAYPTYNGWHVPTKPAYAEILCLVIPSAISENAPAEKKSDVASKSSSTAQAANTGSDQLAKIKSDIAALKKDTSALFKLVENEANDRKQADSKILPSLKSYAKDNERGKTSVFCDKGDIAVGGGFQSAEEIIYSKPIGTSGANPHGWEINPSAHSYVYVVCLDIPSDNIEDAPTEKKSGVASKSSSTAQAANTGSDQLAKIKSDIAALKKDTSALFKLVENEANDRKQADSKILPSLRVYWKESSQKSGDYLKAFCDKGDIVVGGGFSGADYPDNSRPASDGWLVTYNKGGKSIVVCLDATQ